MNNYKFAFFALIGFGFGSLTSFYSGLNQPNCLVNIIEQKTVGNLKFEELYDNYVQKHNRVVPELLEFSNKYNSPNLPKVIVVQPDMHNGYGNRFPGIVCGFLYSIVSDRLFFIDGYKNFEDYFMLDFNHDWQTISNLYVNSSSKYLHEIWSNNFSSIVRGNLSDKVMNSYDVLYVRTWDNVCAPLTSNPYYEEWAREILPNHNIFATISPKLLRLQANISRQVSNFVDEKFSDYNIGVHLRTKKTVGGMINPVEHFCQAVKMLMLGEKRQVTIFVAADTNEARENLVNCIRGSSFFNSSSNYSARIVYLQNNMNVKNSVTGNPGTELNALVDMKLLSLCDDLVVTYGSSFGYVAASWSSKALSRSRGPFFIMPIKNSTEDLKDLDKVWIWSTTSSEPCMYWSKSLMEKEDKETVRIFKSNPLWMHYSQCHWPVFKK